MKKRLMLAALAVAVFAMLAIPVWSALRVRKYRLPVGKTVCVECRGTDTGLWAIYASPRKVVFKCTRVGSSLRPWKKIGSCVYFDRLFKVITLRKGEKLVVRGVDGGPYHHLTLFTFVPRAFTVSN